MISAKYTLAILIFLISSPVLAFIPATGIWGVDSEDNGLPGRGFQIEAENGIIVFTYFGYRADGSSIFHYASGPIVNNTFTAALLDIQGGTSLGGTHMDAFVTGSAGTVTINFTSGTHGIIAFPGEPQRAISKRPFGYADGPDGLLGTWIFTMVIGQSPFSEMRNLSINTGAATPSGNGVVANSAANFGCELQTSGVLSGMVACFNFPQVSGSKSYLVKRSGDKANGIGFVQVGTASFSAAQNVYASRIATKIGIQTGLNDGTPESLTQHSQLVPEQTSAQVNEQLSTEKLILPEDMREIEALKTWTFEAQSALNNIH